VPPAFGITILGSSHGMDACGTCSGYLLWANGKGIMIGKEELYYFIY
jgi:hypothetical protein